MFKDLYKSVKEGKEAARVLRTCSKPDYGVRLGKELDAIGNSEMWQAGKAVRSLRPETAKAKTAKGIQGVSGRSKN